MIKQGMFVIAISFCMLGILWCLPSEAEIIHLRSGGTINGRIIERTPTIYRIEVSPGAVIVLSVDEVREVETIEETSDIPDFGFSLEDIMPRPTLRAVDADLNVATFESRLSQVKSLDELLQEGKGVPRITTQAQLREARERKIPEINLNGQMFFLSPEGRYLPRRGVSAVPTVYAATDTAADDSAGPRDVFSFFGGQQQPPPDPFQQMIPGPPQAPPVEW